MLDARAVAAIARRVYPEGQQSNSSSIWVYMVGQSSFPSSLSDPEA